MHHCRETFINLTHACCVTTSHLTVLSIPTQWNWLEPLCLLFDVEICAQSSKFSGYTSHINYQAKTEDKGNKIANDKRPRCSSSKVLFPINMVELRMSMKVCHLAKFVPSKDISWFYCFPLVNTGSRSNKANHTWYFLFHIFTQSQNNRNIYWGKNWFKF